MVILIVVGELWKIPQYLVKRLNDKGIKRQVETIQTSALLRSARILTSVLITWGDLLSMKLQWKAICLLRHEKLSRSYKNDSSNSDCSSCRSHYKDRSPLLVLDLCLRFLPQKVSDYCGNLLLSHCCYYCYSFVTPLKQLLFLFVCEEGQTSNRFFIY